MEELTYGHSSGNLEDKKAFVEADVHGDFDFTSTATENQTVFFSGDDTAVVRHIFLIEALSKGAACTNSNWQYDGLEETEKAVETIGPSGL